MTTFAIALNERSMYYEVHVAGCKHLMAPHLDFMVERTGATATEVATAYEAANEGCLTKFGPCARKGS